MSQTSTLDKCQRADFPSCTGTGNSAPPDIDQLTSTSLTNVVTHDVYKGAATLAFGSSPADRLEVIPINEVTGGFYFEYQFTLNDGEVVHDYLA